MASTQHFSVCSWGNNCYSQLGIASDPDDEDNVVTTPKLVKFFENSPLLHIHLIACGWNHTVFLSKDGVLYSCGLNDCGQLGHSVAEVSRIERIESLEAQTITRVSCGESYTIIVNDKGQAYSFGSNDKGQLGLGLEEPSKKIPRQIKLNVIIAQVACGKTHAVALSSASHLFSWGSNEHGQLGLGIKSEKIISPQLVSSLVNFPIYKVAAGGHHTVILTISSSVFSWGRNGSGQLGVGDETDRTFPTKLKLLTGKSVHHIACGEEHTAALTSLGRVYTFGAGNAGQLGHNSFDNECNPKMVIELMGTMVTQIACGRKHTMAFVAKSGRLFAFGLGVKGQLGLGSFQKHNNPVVAHSIWTDLPIDVVNRMLKKQEPNHSEEYYFEEDYKIITTEIYNKDNHARHYDNNNNYYNLHEIYAGGLQSFAILTSIKVPNLPLYHLLIKRGRLLFLNQALVERMMVDFKMIPVDKVKQNRHLEILSTIFSNQACLNGSFLKRMEHEESFWKHGIHLTSMKTSLTLLNSVNIVKREICRSVKEKLVASLKIPPSDAEAMRVYLIIPELACFNDMNEMWDVVIPYAHAVQALPYEAHKVLAQWWSSLPPTFFERLVETFKTCVVTLLDQRLPETPNQLIFSLHAALNTCMWTLSKLNEVNNGVDTIVTFNTFYIPGLLEKFDMKADYINWIQQPSVFSFCKYPFALDVKVKALLLQIDAEIQMKIVVNETHALNIAGMLQGIGPVNPFLVLNIRRDYMVQDTLSEILKYRPQDLKKPLKVKFSGEDAEDAGGVKKEFFLLLMKDILDPKYGMFDFYEESRIIWFKPVSFEGPEMFMLIGAICGLAIYNSTIIDVPFPYCLYKKLLKKKVNLDDLRGVQPDIARSLQHLLDYQENDFVDVFDLNFQVVEQSFGEMKSVDLVPNGGDILVTQDNKEEYVDSYIDYKLNSSMKKEYEHFAEGFLRVCGGTVLDFFHPQELMEMIVGCKDYDFSYLEKVAGYKGEYYRQHPVINNFWDVFHGFTLDLKKKFLAFLTGSDRVPIFGLKSMKFIIQPVPGGDKGEHLPVAHTCFNLLDLPRYSNVEIMRKKLRQAIENSEGFGLV